MKKQKRANNKTDTYHYKKSKRTKIPTDSDDKYMKDEDHESTLFYPEKRSEDGEPRLSWRRNTELEDIARKAHPLYIQEKIDPSWFVNHLIDNTDEDQTKLFGFNGFPEGSKYDWYKHKGNWSNRIIHGDASRIMSSLLYKEGMKGEVQMIYFDPPYGINFDHMYQISTKKISGGAPKDTKSKRVYRDTYRDGIHSYIDTIYRIATYSRNLLKESGSFFLQIGSEHVHRLAIVLDEVFGAENRVVTIPFTTTGASSSKTLSDAATWLLWYAKDKEKVKFYQLYEELSRKEKVELMKSFAMKELPNGTCYSLNKNEKNDPDNSLSDDVRLFRHLPVTSQQPSKSGRSEPFTWNGQKFYPPKNRHWSVSLEGLERLGELGRLLAVEGGVGLSWKQYEEEIPGRKINNIWKKKMSPSNKHFIVETAELTIERCILMATDPGDLVFDPTCGSGTTAFVAEKWGRRWITADVNSIQISLCRQRIITSVNDWYLTKDSYEGKLKEAKLSNGKLPKEKQESSSSQYDPSSGFVYERVPYVSPATLAYDLKSNPIYLVNKPNKKSGIKRISSPFTVESLSPHKYVNIKEYDENKETFKTIEDALSISGIIIPNSKERWHLENMNAWANGEILTHEAQLRETGEKVAIVLLSDDNTAGVNLINHAAEEATEFPKIKKLFIIAFEFEAMSYDKKTEKRGKIEIHKIKVNDDIGIKELAPKKDDASFVMLGEPDIEVNKKGKKYTVEIKGYDTFNPETGMLNYGVVDTVDCWLLDTNYDGQSFFARRVHFPDKENDKQLNDLKDKLKNMNKDHWDSMISLKSTPFEKPTSGRIAVRIITEHGEVMTTIHDV